MAVLIAGLALVVPALAQTAPVPIPRPSPVDDAAGDPATADTGGPATTLSADDLADEGSSGDGMDAVDPAELTADSVPDAPDPGPPQDIRPGSFTLEARLTLDGQPLSEGVKWRIFADQPGADGRLPLLGEASGGVIYIRLDPGIYYIHAAFGHAGLARKIEVKDATGGAVFVLNAGGMRLLALNGKDVPLHGGDVGFDVYAPDEGGSDERFLLVQNAPPGKVVALPAGTYHVISRYGEANAIVRADIRVDAGKLTEATVYQKAARLTLKLVEVHGGEALADTAWSVITPGGDNVIESVGAFPTVVLAAGDYRAIAKHDGKTFETNFTVEAAVDRDIEVLLP